MFGFLKYSIAFFLFYVVLSIPFDNTPLFSHLHEVTHPLTKSIIGKVEEQTLSALSSLKEFGQKLFSNATPSYSDSISVKRSAIKRKTHPKPEPDELVEVNNSVWDIDEENEEQILKEEVIPKKSIKKSSKNIEDHSQEDQKKLEGLLKSES
jgi:hypothetical protein